MLEPGEKEQEEAGEWSNMSLHQWSEFTAPLVLMQKKNTDIELTLVAVEG